MKLTSTITFLFLAASTMTSCLNDDEPKDKVRTTDVTVLSETYITFPFMDSHRQMPVEMLVIVEDNGQQDLVHPTEIKGFDWERGYSYRLSVDKTTLANPPMDAGNVTYRLRKIHSKQKDNSFNPSDIKVSTETDVAYAPEAPAEIYVPDWSGFSIDDSGEISGVIHNTLTQELFHETIFFIYSLPKSSPLYCRWNYLAEKIYVSSPFSTQLRQITYHPSLQISEIIPKSEQKRIVKEFPHGETICYDLYFYNAENLAIQKYSISLTRI